MFHFRHVAGDNSAKLLDFIYIYLSYIIYILDGTVYTESIRGILLIKGK